MQLNALPTPQKNIALPLQARTVSVSRPSVGGGLALLKSDTVTFAGKPDLSHIKADKNYYLKLARAEDLPATINELIQIARSGDAALKKTAQSSFFFASTKTQVELFKGILQTGNSDCFTLARDAFRELGDDNGLGPNRAPRSAILRELASQGMDEFVVTLMAAACEPRKTVLIGDNISQSLMKEMFLHSPTENLATAIGRGLVAAGPEKLTRYLLKQTEHMWDASALGQAFFLFSPNDRKQVASELLAHQKFDTLANLVARGKAEEIVDFLNAPEYKDIQKPLARKLPYFMLDTVQIALIQALTENRNPELAAEVMLGINVEKKEDGKKAPFLAKLFAAFQPAAQATS